MAVVVVRKGSYRTTVNTHTDIRSNTHRGDWLSASILYIPYPTIYYAYLQLILYDYYYNNNKYHYYYVWVIYGY